MGVKISGSIEGEDKRPACQRESGRRPPPAAPTRTNASGQVASTTHLAGHPTPAYGKARLPSSRGVFRKHNQNATTTARSLRADKDATNHPRSPPIRREQEIVVSGGTGAEEGNRRQRRASRWANAAGYRDINDGGKTP